jgi:hypothetical protein
MYDLPPRLQPSRPQGEAFNTPYARIAATPSYAPPQPSYDLPIFAALRQPAPQGQAFNTTPQPPALALTPATWAGLQQFDIPMHALARRPVPQSTGVFWPSEKRGIDPVIGPPAPVVLGAPGYAAGGSGGPGYTIDKAAERRRMERWYRSGFGFYKTYAKETVSVQDRDTSLNSQGEKRIILGEKKPSRFDATGKTLPRSKITTADVPPLQQRIDAILAHQRAAEQRENEVRDDDEDFLETFLLHGGF